MTNYTDMKDYLEEQVVPPPPQQVPVTVGLENALVALDNLCGEYKIGSEEFRSKLNTAAAQAIHEVRR